MPANPLHWFPFNADDYLTDPAVLMMSAEAEGCYIRLLMRSWRSPTPGMIPLSLIPEMSAVYRVPESERSRVLSEMVRAFEESSTGWVQKRMVAEHADASRIHDAQSRGGKTRSRSAGRSPRGHFQDTSSYARVGVGVDSTETEEAEDSEPSTNGKGKAEETVRSPKDEWLEAFTEDFYSGYPRKVKPDDARKAWLQVKPWNQETCDAIFAGLERWKVYWRESETPRDKIPYPATFLRSGAWRGEAG